MAQRLNRLAGVQTNNWTGEPVHPALVEIEAAKRRLGMIIAARPGHELQMS